LIEITVMTDDSLIVLDFAGDYEYADCPENSAIRLPSSVLGIK